MPHSYTVHVNQKQFEEKGQIAGKMVLAKKKRLYTLARKAQKNMLDEFFTRQVNKPNDPKGIAKNPSKERLAKAIQDGIKYARQKREFPMGETWVNRTARAASRVHGYTNEDDGGIEVGIAHGMWYGVYLEYADKGRFAVIAPLMRKHAPSFLKKVRELYIG